MDVTAVQHLPLTLELTTLIREVAQQGNSQPTIVSVVERTWSQDVTELFARGRLVTTERFLYSRPSEGFSLAGFGAASVINSVGAARFRQAATARRTLMAGARIEGLHGLPGTGPLFFGGFAFDPQTQASGLWADFGDGRLVMPRVLYTQHGKDAYLTLNILVNASTNPEIEAAETVALWQELISLPTPSPRHQPEVISTQDLRPAADWQADVAYAAKKIQQGDLEKTVLARAVQVTANQTFDLPTALRRLIHDYSDCHVFAVAHDDSCFLGATPECLLRLQHGNVTTMSLAGSLKRGTTPEEDQQLGEHLLNSTKDRHEHAVVVREIVEKLRAYVNDLRYAGEPVLLKLRNVQHLCTPITGQLANGYTLLDLITELHPTPAVGGRPRQVALNLIREREKLDRGWYAAPIGWVDAQGDGEFVVALRSALIHGAQATLFAGCGIVGDSDPEQELAESNWKLRPMLSALASQ
ncbi:MAG: isochorismate synthase [Anaerolineae bacterium]|nr:isochorismate synthase [Anaerolineae bacterium]